MLASYYGGFADHLPSVLFLFAGWGFLCWWVERKSREPFFGRGEAVENGSRDRRSSPNARSARPASSRGLSGRDAAHRNSRAPNTRSDPAVPTFGGTRGR